MSFTRVGLNQIFIKHLMYSLLKSMCLNNIQLNSINTIPLFTLYHNPQTVYSFHIGEENYNEYVIACLSDYKWQRGWSLNTKGEGSIKHYQFLK